MKNKRLTLMVAIGILTIGLFIIGLLATRGPTHISPTGLHSSMKDTDLWMAASISKETLLLLLVVGIAGVLGMSRKKKDLKNKAPHSKSDHPSEP